MVEVLGGSQGGSELPPWTDKLLLLDEKDVDALASAEVGLAAARDAAAMVAAGRLTTGRVQVGDEVTWSRVLLGILPDLDLLGYKELHRVGRRVRYHVSLFRRSTGDAVALVDGRRITSLRTAATAACAARHHFGEAPAPLRLGLVGSGEEAREGLRALAAALPLGRVAVWSPTAANREAFARALGAELGLPVEPAASVPAALDGNDLAYVGTAAREPFVTAGQVASVGFVAAIGSTRPDQRELAGDVAARAGAVVVDCGDALHESGDLLEAIATYGWDPGDAVLLGDWLARPPTRPEPAAPVLFKSVGSVEQDLVLAHHLVELAAARGRGRAVDPVGSLRTMRQRPGESE